MRCALGRALLAADEILLMDEPFIGLDPALTDQVLVFMRQEVRRLGLQLIMVSHSMEECEFLTTCSCRICDGRIDMRRSVAAEGRHCVSTPENT